MTEIELKKLIKKEPEEISKIINEVPLAWSDILDTLRVELEKETQTDHIRFLYLYKLLSVKNTSKEELIKCIDFLKLPENILTLFNEFHGISLKMVIKKVAERVDGANIYFDDGKILYELATDLDTDIEILLESLNSNTSTPMITYPEAGEYNDYPIADWLKEYVPEGDTKLKRIIEEWENGHIVYKGDREYFITFIKKTISLILNEIGNLIAKTNNRDAISCFASDFPACVNMTLMTKMGEFGLITEIVSVLSYYYRLYKTQQEEDDKTGMLETLNKLQELLGVIQTTEWFKNLIDLTEVINNIKDLDSKGFELQPIDN